MKTEKTLNEWGRDELLKLPIREIDTESEYDSLLLISTNREHASGWAIIAIIGVRDGKPIEIACDCCDDIEWRSQLSAITSMTRYPYFTGKMRMDCALRSGAMHVWARKTRFRVGWALSSIIVELLVEE